VLGFGVLQWWWMGLGFRVLVPSPRKSAPHTKTPKMVNAFNLKPFFKKKGKKKKKKIHLN
jgi:hypothetical protein